MQFWFHNVIVKYCISPHIHISPHIQRIYKLSPCYKSVLSSLLETGTQSWFSLHFLLDRPPYKRLINDSVFYFITCIVCDGPVNLHYQRRSAAHVSHWCSVPRGLLEPSWRHCLQSKVAKQPQRRLTMLQTMLNGKRIRQIFVQRDVMLGAF